jgi:hypothetical protein
MHYSSFRHTIPTSPIILSLFCHAGNEGIGG